VLPPPELAVLVAGSGLLGGAVGWRTVSLRRSVDLVGRGLRHPDREMRLEAIDLIGNGGVRRYADTLIDLAADEQDARVWEAFVDLLARNQWEPADDPRIVKLRFIARERAALRETPAPAAPPVDAVLRAAGPEPRPPAEPASGGAGIFAAIRDAVGEDLRYVRIEDGSTTAVLDLRPPPGAGRHGRRPLGLSFAG
jgi:hypothetical protein